MNLSRDLSWRLLVTKVFVDGLRFQMARALCWRVGLFHLPGVVLPYTLFSPHSLIFADIKCFSGGEGFLAS